MLVKVIPYPFSGQLCPDFLFFCGKFLSIAGQRPYNSVANIVLQMLLAVAMLIGQYSECMSLTPRLCRATKSPCSCRKGSCPRRVTRQRHFPGNHRGASGTPPSYRQAITGNRGGVGAPAMMSMARLCRLGAYTPHSVPASRWQASRLPAPSPLQNS